MGCGEANIRLGVARYTAVKATIKICVESDASASTCEQHFFFAPAFIHESYFYCFTAKTNVSGKKCNDRKSLGAYGK